MHIISLSFNFVEQSCDKLLLQASSSASINNKEEDEVNCEEDEFIDIDSLLNDDTLMMSISP